MSSVDYKHSFYVKIIIITVTVMIIIIFIVFKDDLKPLSSNQLLVTLYSIMKLYHDCSLRLRWNI